MTGTPTLRPILLAGILLAVLAMTLLAGNRTTEAQSSTKLVGNTSYIYINTPTKLNTVDAAQQFSTGVNNRGYVVTGVGFRFRGIANSSTKYAVSIHTVDVSGAPGTQIAQLNSPASLAANSVNTWTHPGIYLGRNQAYFVVIDSSDGANNELTSTQYPLQENGSEIDWEIANSSRFRPKDRTSGSWGTDNNILQIQVNGYARTTGARTPTTPRVSSDPDATTTLSATWLAPDPIANISITDYDVQYRTGDGQWNDSPHSGTATSTTITGLTAGTSYEVQVRARTATGHGNWSASGYGTAGAQGSRLVVSNTGQANEFDQNANLSTHDIFQPFTTGTDADSYTIHAAELMFLNVLDGGGTVPDVRIFTDLNGRPNLPVGQAFTKPARLVGANDGVNTWTTKGIELQPGTTYHLGVISVGAAAHVLRNSSSDNEDGGGIASWSIANGQSQRARGTQNYSQNSKSLKMRFWGKAAPGSWAPPGTLVSNTGFGQQGVRDLGTWDTTQAFTTGSDPDGYVITGIGIELNPTATARYEISIHRANPDGRPTILVASLEKPAEIHRGLNFWRNPGIFLGPNTTYVILVDSYSAGANNISYTDNPNQDGGGLQDWDIVGTAWVRDRNTSGPFGSWLRFIQPNNDELYLRLNIQGFARYSPGPHPPSTPRVDSDPSSPTALTAHWRPPDTLSVFPIRSYDVRYRVQGSTGDWSSGPQNRTTTSATITGLTNGTAYEVQVRATNIDGDSVWSASGYATAGAVASGVVISNTAQANEFTDNTNLSTHDVFHPFRTGSSSDGYTITTAEILFLSVADWGRTVPYVGIYTDHDNRGAPGTFIGYFDRPKRLAAGNDGVATYTSQGITLQPNTDYVLSVETAGDATHIVRNTSSSSADAGAARGWQIYFGHQKRIRGTGNYTPVFKSLKMRFYGYAEPGNLPVFGQRRYTRTVDENSAGGVNVGAPITATDADGDLLTYVLDGPDFDSFQVVQTTGQIQTKAGVVYDHEGKNQYSLEMTVTDGITTVRVPVTINLNDIYEPSDNPCLPEVIEPGTFSGHPINDSSPGVYQGVFNNECVGDTFSSHPGSSYRLYQFTLTETTKVMLALESGLYEHTSDILPTSYSERFDPYMLLYTNYDRVGERKVGENDDIDFGAGNFSAGMICPSETGPDWDRRTVCESLPAGTYTVYTTTYSPGKRGDFRLLYMHEGDTPLALPERQALLGDFTDFSFTKPADPPTPGTGGQLENLSVAEVAGNADALDVSWTAVTDADEYLVKWKGPGESYNPGEEITSSSYRITGLTAGTTYTVEVQAIDTDADPDEVLATGEADGATYAEWVTSFVIYHDPDAGDASVNRYNQAVALLTGAGISYTEVTGDVGETAGRLAGVTNSVLPRFFLGDPTESDWTSQPRVNNGGLRWLREKVAELNAEPAADLTGLSASQVDGDGSALDVSWDTVTDADKYQVRWKTGDAAYNAWRETTGNSYQITGLTAGTAYTVSVSAVDTDADPEATLATGETTATTWADDQLENFSIAEVVGTGTALDVSWTAAADADKYLVRWKGPGGSYNTGEETTASSYRITGLMAETTYTVSVDAIDTDVSPEYTVVSGEATGTTWDEGDIQNLSVDSVLGVETELAVSWTAVSGADKYLVRWKTGDADFNDGQETTKTSYKITGLTRDTAYTVEVQAIDTNLNPDATLSRGQAAGTTYLRGNLNVAVSPASGVPTALEVSWDAIADADSYKVAWGSTERRTSGTSYRITGLSLDSDYRVDVTAYDTGTGADVELAAAHGNGRTLPSMGTVTVRPVKGSGDSLDVSWNAVSGATGYRVEYKTGSDSYTTVTRSSATAITERITGLTPNATYTVRITALHTIGGQTADGDSSEGSGTTNLAALSGLKALPKAGKTTELAVSWPAFAGTDRYIVQWKTGSGGYNTGDVTAETYRVLSSLRADTAYTVRVTAVDRDVSPHTNRAVAEATGKTLDAMGTVTVRAVTDSTDSLNVSWSAVKGATGYRVEYKTGEEAYTTFTRSDGTALTEQVTGLTHGTAYTVRVTALHTIGGQTADGDSAEGSGTTNSLPPDDPEGTVAPELKVSFSVINIGTWFVWDTLDEVGGATVTGYTIEWASSEGGPWTGLSAPGEGRRCVPGMAPLDEDGRDGCYFAYADSVSPSGPASGQTYYFRLIAHAGSADSSPGPVLQDTLR